MPTDKLRGKLVVFEGIDGAGKSSIVARLPEVLKACKVGITTLGELRSPVGPWLRTSIRSLSPFLKTYFFAADRAWTYEKECLPALSNGNIVLWDRYTDSAIAYRGVELGPGDPVNLSFVKAINEPFPAPDLSFYIDVSVEATAGRRGIDEPYSPEFLSQVRDRYLELAGPHRYVQIDGERDPAIVVSEVAMAIRIEFPDLFA